MLIILCVVLAIAIANPYMINPLKTRTVCSLNDTSYWPVLYLSLNQWGEEFFFVLSPTDQDHWGGCESPPVVLTSGGNIFAVSQTAGGIYSQCFKVMFKNLMNCNNRFKAGLLKLLLASTKVLAKTFACARGHCFKRALLCSPEDYCARTMTVEKERSNLLTNILSLKSAEFIVIFVLWLAA